MKRPVGIGIEENLLSELDRIADQTGQNRSMLIGNILTDFVRIFQLTNKRMAVYPVDHSVDSMLTTLAFLTGTSPYQAANTILADVLTRAFTNAETKLTLENLLKETPEDKLCSLEK